MDTYWNKVLLFTVCCRTIIALCFKRLFRKRTDVNKY